MFLRGSLRILLPFLAAIAVPTPTGAQGRIDPPATADIVGTLTMFGCTPAPEAFELFGIPMVPDFVSRSDAIGDADDPTPPSAPLRGELGQTDNPNMLSVRLRSASLGIAYQLRIVAYPPNPCERVFWEGLEEGITFAGATVNLRGYAPRSSIEVLARQPVGTPRRGWVGIEQIDVQNFSDATRQMRWLTNLPGITGGRIQVATEEFPKEDLPDGGCAPANGLLFQTTFAASSGAWNMLPTLNFAAIAAGVAFSGPSGVQRYNQFTYGAPLYVRVLPLAGRSVRCNALENGPAPWVVLANAQKVGGTKIFFGADPPGPPPPQPITLTDQSNYTPPSFWDHPQGGETAYRVVHEHTIPSDIFTGFPVSFGQDPFAYLIAKHTSLGPGNTIPRNYHFWFKPGSGGFDIGDVFEGAVSIVTGAIDAVGYLVDQVSKAYASIKKAVATVIVAAIDGTGLVNCSASPPCKDVVAAGINAGLAAAGMPPALPNWHDVVDHATEYAAAEVLSQAGLSSIPGAQDLTEYAARQVVEETSARMDKNRGGGSGLPKWLMVDLGQDPAVLLLELRNPNLTSPLFPNYLKSTPSSVFLGWGVDLPSKGWRVTNTLDKCIKVPVVLRPNLAGFTPPPFSVYVVGIAAKSWWKAKLESTLCAKSDNQFMVKTGPLLVSSTFTLTSLSYPPNTTNWFPPFMSCVP